MQGAWRPALNLSTVLASIGLLLAEPNPDDGLMTDMVGARPAAKCISSHCGYVAIGKVACLLQRIGLGITVPACSRYFAVITGTEPVLSPWQHRQCLCMMQ